MSTSPRAGATSDPASEHELTPAQEAMDARDWSFDGAWPYEPRWHRADGVRLHYVDEGPSANEAVVMLHGSPTWGFLYRKLIAGLRDRDQRAIAFDQLGFGRSDKPHRQREYSLARHCVLFDAFVDRLELDNVTLVVHDWGGPIGLSWAVRHPERVKALVILNTFLDPARERLEPVGALERAPLARDVMVKGAHRALRRAVRAGDGAAALDPAELRAYEQPHPSWDSRTGILAFARAASGGRGGEVRSLANDVENGIGALADKPVAIIWGVEDQALPRSLIDAWRGRLPQAHVRELPGVGHLVPESASDELVVATAALSAGKEAA